MTIVAAWLAGGALVVGVLLAAGALGGGSTKTVTAIQNAAATTETVADTTSAGGTSDEALYAQTSPGVVEIKATMGAGGGGTGSGFEVDDEGTVVTAAHVVDEATSVRVLLQDGSTRSAEVLGVDDASDLAVIRFDPEGAELHLLEMADSAELKVGASVAAIGAPFEYAWSFSTGIVSGLDRTIEAPNGFTVAHAIQTDAAVNPGNSGGPLLDAEGDVIGVVDQIATDGSADQSSGVGFAVPSNLVVAELARLEAGETVEHAYLGVATSSGEAVDGAQVAEVPQGSPAAEAGVKQGDVITELDGETIGDSEDLVAAIAEHEPGDAVTLEVETRLQLDGAEGDARRPAGRIEHGLSPGRGAAALRPAASTPLSSRSQALYKNPRRARIGSRRRRHLAGGSPGTGALMTESVAASSTRPARRRRLRTLTTAFVWRSSPSGGRGRLRLGGGDRSQPRPVQADPPLRAALPPAPPAPANSLLAEEASGVTYDPVTETLFIVGDGGTSVVQVDKEGKLINSMTLAPGSARRARPSTTPRASPTSARHGEEFVITEERESKLDRFTYVPGGELTRAAVKTVMIGNDNDNIGIEGVTNDPLNPGHMIAVKESGPERIYSTDIDWAAETATNFEGTAGEGELFPAADAGTLDFSDVYALANVPGISAAEESNLLVISQESGEVVNISRAGHVNSRLAELAEPSDTISVPEMTNEGVTMDQNGTLYIVDEDGGGSQAHPQLWVYEPQTAADTPPTAVTLGNQVELAAGSDHRRAGQGRHRHGHRPRRLRRKQPQRDRPRREPLRSRPQRPLPEGRDGAESVDPGRIRSHGRRSTTRPRRKPRRDQRALQADRHAERRRHLLGAGRDHRGRAVEQRQSPFEADWFELTNVGTTKVDLTGWRMNDNHASFASSVPMEGVTSLAPGHSAVFVNGTEAKANEFIADWFPGGAPAGFQIGWLPEGRAQHGRRPGQHLRLDRGQGLRRRIRRLAGGGALRHLRQHRRARRRRDDRPDHHHAQRRRHERSLQRQRRQRNRLAGHRPGEDARWRSPRSRPGAAAGPNTKPTGSS